MRLFLLFLFFVFFQCSVIAQCSTPTISANGPTTFCQGESVTLGTTIATNASYQWKLNGTTNVGVNSPSYIATSGGSYTVTVTGASDGLGGTCATSTSNATLVTVNALPTVSISAGSLTTFCQGGNVVLTSSTGTSYLWSTGATTSSITANTSGSYSVTVTNASGCQATSSPTAVTVNTPPNASVSAGSTTTFCQGGTVLLNANTGSGLTYLWSSGATTPSITASTSGSYSVTVTNANGCQTTSSATAVTVNTPPNASISAGSTTTFCQGGSVVLTANTGAGLSYQWRLNGTNITNATSSSYSANANGSYTVVVTNTSTCSATSMANDVTVNNLPLAPTSPNNFSRCGSGAVSLSATAPSGSTIDWYSGASGGTSLLSGSVSYTTPVIIATGTYYVESRNSATGCVSSNRTIVTATVNPVPAITSANTASICSGSPVNFQMTSNVTSTYNWLATSNSNVAGESLSVQNTSIINNTLAHSFNSNQIVDYTVTPTSNGCDGQSQIVSITVKPRPSIISNLQQAICSEQQFTFTPQNGTNGIVPANTTLTWTVSSSNVNGGINNTTAGVNSIIQTLTNTNYANNQVVYTITPEANLCEGNSFDYTVIVSKAPNLIVSPTSTICEGNSIQLFAVDAFNSGQLFYNWTNSSTLNNSNIFNPIASPTSTTPYSVSVTDNTTQCQITRSVTVNVSPLPAAIATYTGSSSICQGSSFLLSANAGNGLTYQWKLNDVSLLGQTSSTYTATTAGVYSVVVTNSSSCSKTSQGVSVSVNPLPVADISNLSTTSFCEGQSVFLNTTNVIGNTYVWRFNGNIIPNATASGFNAAASGNYSVTVLNSATQCSNTSPALVITVNTLPTASINPQGGTVCQGGSVTLQVNSSAELSYQWRLNDINIPNETTSSYSATSSGVYSVVVTNSNGCSKTSNGQTVIVNPLPIADVSNLSTTTFCQGESVIFNTTNVAGNTYQWKLNGIDIPGADLYSYEADGTGSYSVQVTNTNSCSALSPAIDVLVNTLPVVNISALDSVLCFGESTALIATGASTYSWTPAGLVSSSSIANPSAFPTSTTNFGVTGTDINGCPDYQEIQIVVVPNPSLDLPSSIEACQGSTVSLPGSASIAWTGVTSTNDFSAEQSGYAVATLQNSNFCSSMDSIYIQVNLLPVPNISGASSVCANASYSEYVVNSTGNLFSWNVSNGEFQGIDNGNTAIIHWFDQEYGPSTFVTITEHDIHSGCEGSDTLFVSFAGLAPNTTIVSLLYPNGSTLFSAEHYAIMNWGSTIISNNVDEYTDGHAQYYTFDNFDTALRYYWIEAGDDSLCLTRSYYNAPVWQVGVQETTDNSLIRIYPNPTSDVLNLSVDAKNSISSFSIYDGTGHLVKQEFNFKNQSVIDVSELPVGFYILKANDIKGSYFSQTFVKK